MLESVPEQGVHTAPPPMRTTSNGLKRPSELRGPGDPEEKGRLSNPVQRRLSAAEIEQLIHLYPQGASIDALACRYQVHRTTVIHHLDRAGIARRRVVRKMTDESVALAAARYEQGASLALVASEFGVHQRTLTRELRRAGASIRPRRGWRR
ncbi:MAG: helix-turn-helix domain-containing protein [Acidimicrobiales bacterium]